MFSFVRCQLWTVLASAFALPGSGCEGSSPIPGHRTGDLLSAERSGRVARRISRPYGNPERRCASRGEWSARHLARSA